MSRLPEIRALFRFLQILSSLTFVVLYVWGTYATPKPLTWRFNLDIALCALFATEWLWRLVVRLLQPCPVHCAAVLVSLSTCCCTML